MEQFSFCLTKERDTFSSSAHADLTDSGLCSLVSE